VKTVLQPHVLGSGRAADALCKSFAILGAMEKDWEVLPPVRLKRGEAIAPAAAGAATPVLCVANPPGLHARALLEGQKAGFPLIVVEKPACVSLEESSALRSVRTPVAVCHVYRQTWGVQTLRSMLAGGELGELVAVEGRYWQSSAAQRLLGERPGGGWKNDPALSGGYDALLDVGTHWVDAALFLAQDAPASASLWLGYAAAEAPHRDSHVQLSMTLKKGARLFASISKAYHGATNHFELNVVGTRGTATWNFLRPDQLELGAGGGSRVLARRDAAVGSRQPPFHGLGWLEGYVEIVRRAVAGLGGARADYPALPAQLDMLELLLSAKIERGPRAPTTP
jgi:predicted dehydrogenase